MSKAVSRKARPEDEPFATDGPSSLGWPGLASGEFGVLENKENDMPVGMRLNPTTRSEREGTHGNLTHGLSIYTVSPAHVRHLLPVRPSEGVLNRGA